MTKMLHAVLTLVVGLSSVVPQGVLGMGSVQATYFPSPLGVTNRVACKDFYEKAQGQVGTSGAFFTKSNEKTICIKFIRTDEAGNVKEIWRRDDGQQGNCRGDCCEWFWFDPKKPAPPPPPKPWLQWFASLDGTCDNVAAAEATPWIFTNTPSGTYQVCMRPREPAAVRPGQDRWQLVNVTVNDSQCGGEGKKCCPFGLANKDSFPFEPVESSGEPRG